MADVDEAAYRIVRAHIASGLFDVPRIAAPDADVSTPQSEAFARELAERGAVLLKNDGVLPLAGSGTSIAVVGPTAANTPATDDIDASSVCLHTAPNIPCTAVAPLDGITARAAAAGSTVTYADGSDLAAAAATAAAADVAVVFGYYQEGEFADRPNISLDGGGDALIDAVAAANPDTVVVLQTGGPVVMPWIDAVDGVLEVWYAGEQMGPAIAALLWGDVAPSGKLTHSFPRSEADLPTAGDPERYPGTFSDGSVVRPPGNTEPRQVEYKEGLRVGYRWYAAQDIAPLFPFGHGLTYTHVRVRQAPGDADDDERAPGPADPVPGDEHRPADGHRDGAGVRRAAGVHGRTVEAAARLAEGHLGAWRVARRSRSRSAPPTSPTCTCCSTGTPTAAGGRPRRARYRVSVGTSFDTALADRFTIR